jgi:hypothetical protein
VPYGDGPEVASLADGLDPVEVDLVIGSEPMAFSGAPWFAYWADGELLFVGLDLECDEPASGVSFVEDDALFGRSSAALAFWGLGAMMGHSPPSGHNDEVPKAWQSGREAVGYQKKQTRCEGRRAGGDIEGKWERETPDITKAGNLGGMGWEGGREVGRGTSGVESLVKQRG